MNWSATASRLKTYPCCNRHQAHQHAHFASSGTGLHIGRYPLSILSILIIRSIFQSPNQCLSIWPVALQLESCSTFCPSTRFDCISLKPTNLLDSACKRVYWILRLDRWSYEKAAIITSLLPTDAGTKAFISFNLYRMTTLISYFLYLAVTCICYPGVSADSLQVSSSWVFPMWNNSNVPLKKIETLLFGSAVSEIFRSWVKAISGPKLSYPICN
jgi:hypothetical protein